MPRHRTCPDLPSRQRGASRPFRRLAFGLAVSGLGVVSAAVACSSDPEFADGIVGTVPVSTTAASPSAAGGGSPPPTFIDANHIFLVGVWTSTGRGPVTVGTAAAPAATPSIEISDQDGVAFRVGRALDFGQHDDPGDAKDRSGRGVVNYDGSISMVAVGGATTITGWMTDENTMVVSFVHTGATPAAGRTTLVRQTGVTPATAASAGTTPGSGPPGSSPGTTRPGSTTTARAGTQTGSTTTTKK